jgi:hypothetical protein
MRQVTYDESLSGSNIDSRKGSTPAIEPIQEMRNTPDMVLDRALRVTAVRKLLHTIVKQTEKFAAFQPIAGAHQTIRACWWGHHASTPQPLLDDKMGRY